jgi:hypothetical protein
VKPKVDDRLSEALYIRVAKDDLARLDALVERIPIASRNAIARTAMRLGIALLEEDPARVLASPLPRRGGRRS